MEAVKWIFVGAVLTGYLMTVALAHGWIPAHGSNIEKAVCKEIER